MNKFILTFVLLLLLLFILIIISLKVGAVSVPISEIYTTIFGTDQNLIISKIRLPRIISAIAIGSSLSIAGVVMQSIFKNPLAEPYTTGVSGAALLGVSFVYLFKLDAYWGQVAIALGAFIGTIPLMMLISSSALMSSIDKKSILLTGVVVSYVTSSMVTLILMVSTSDTMGNIIRWGFGSLQGTTLKPALFLAMFSIGSLILFLFHSLNLNALLLGESEATSLGVHISLIRTLLLLVATVLTAISVSIGGIIGFVGLIVPHFARFIVGNDNRFLLPISWIMGAIILLFADTIGRTIILPQEIPVGVITGIIGGALFFVLLQKIERSNG